jgi:hypothetical protein
MSPETRGGSSLERVYFYKDADGTLKRNQYCSFCGKGPFPETLVGEGVYFNRGTDDHPTITCRMCDITKFPFQERVVLTPKGSQFMKSGVVTDVVVDQEVKPVEETAKEVVTDKPVKVKTDKPAKVRVNKATLNGDVAVGQVWRDTDRRRNRTITITRLEGDDAYYLGNMNTEIRISVNRLRSRFNIC